MKRILAAIALLGASLTARADPYQYLCVSEQSTGLHYDNQSKNWAPQAFGAGKKYILRRLNDDDRKTWSFLLKTHPTANWAFFDFGNNVPIALCADAITFSCVWGSMEFDKGSLRFERAYYGGYVTQGYWEKLRADKPNEYNSAVKYHRAIDPDKPDDSFFEIGKCSPF